HRQQMPLPLAPQQRIGQILQMLPALSLAIIAPAGGNHMQVGMVVTISSMRVEHRDVTTLERLAPDFAKEIIHALHPASHQCAQQDRGVVVKGGAEHRWYRENDVPRDHPLVEGLAHLADTG
ncbi:MAG TPA: hypothetical protein VK667_15110, partial [Ktedonobacteraceae bacterium]|nr:hypothetical protein [Ktedonobacteraceae bacterium]